MHQKNARGQSSCWVEDGSELYGYCFEGEQCISYTEAVEGEMMPKDHAGGSSFDLLIDYILNDTQLGAHNTTSVLICVILHTNSCSSKDYKWHRQSKE